jgi:hypothetical protein
MELPVQISLGVELSVNIHGLAADYIMDQLHHVQHLEHDVEMEAQDILILRKFVMDKSVVITVVFGIP